MNFEASQKETIILDPGNNMARKAIPSEIRKDPLTGRSSRICHFMKLQWEKPDFEKMVAGTEQGFEHNTEFSRRHTPGGSINFRRHDSVPQYCSL